MKKARINLSKGVKSWSFFIYDSSESAFYLKDLADDEDFDEEYRRSVVITRGDFVEIEWMGSEWVHHEETGRDEKYDMIRLAKLVAKENSTTTGYVEIYSGWTAGSTFDWTGRHNTNTMIKVIPIKGRMKHRLDFSKLFSYQKNEEENGDEMPHDPKELN